MDTERVVIRILLLQFLHRKSDYDSLRWYGNARAVQPGVIILRARVPLEKQDHFVA